MPDESFKYNVVQGNPDQELTVLIRKAVVGDQAAFSQIYKLHSGKMYSLCKRYAGSSGDADDYFQEGYIKVYRNLESYSGSGSFEGWLRRIFVNTCLDFLRKKSERFSMVDIDDSTDMLVAESSQMPDKLSNDELVKMIQAMPEGYRIIVNLYLVEGYSHREIADMLGISEGTSKSQLSKAKNKLKEMITKRNA
jgi:RNA polymerase sigma-70 factor (ECF subfamily)